VRKADNSLERTVPNTQNVFGETAQPCGGGGKKTGMSRVSASLDKKKKEKKKVKKVQQRGREKKKEPSRQKVWRVARQNKNKREKGPRRKIWKKGHRVYRSLKLPGFDKEKEITGLSESEKKKGERKRKGGSTRGDTPGEKSERKRGQRGNGKYWGGKKKDRGQTNQTRLQKKRDWRAGMDSKQKDQGNRVRQPCKCTVKMSSRL